MPATMSLPWYKSISNLSPFTLSQNIPVLSNSLKPSPYHSLRLFFSDPQSVLFVCIHLFHPITSDKASRVTSLSPQPRNKHVYPHRRTLRGVQMRVLQASHAAVRVSRRERTPCAGKSHLCWAELSEAYKEEMRWGFRFSSSLFCCHSLANWGLDGRCKAL